MNDCQPAGFHRLAFALLMLPRFVQMSSRVHNTLYPSKTMRADMLAVMFDEALPPADWEDTITQTAWSGFCQTTERAEYLAEVEWAKPLYIEVYRDQAVQAAALFLKRFVHRRGFPIYFPWYPVLNCHDGPMMINGQDFEALERMLAWLKEYARETKALRISGTFSRTAPPEHLEACTAILQRQGYSVSPWGTFLVDLNLEEEQLLKGLDHSVRKNIRKCQDMGVSCRRIADMAEFEHLFFATYKNSENAYGRSCYPFSSFKPLLLPPMDRFCDYFVATTSEGTPLATLGLTCFNRTGKETVSTLTPLAYESKIPAQDLLHWHVIKFAKEKGMSIFDMAGVNPEPVTEKERGIYRFKKKWGGKYQTSLLYSFEVPSLANTCFMKLRNTLRKR